jgi:hypothetical protein
MSLNFYYPQKYCQLLYLSHFEFLLHNFQCDILHVISNELIWVFLGGAVAFIVTLVPMDYTIRFWIVQIL